MEPDNLSLMFTHTNAQVKNNQHNLETQGREDLLLTTSRHRHSKVWTTVTEKYTNSSETGPYKYGHLAYKKGGPRDW